jgi:hypothetical protein
MSETARELLGQVSVAREQALAVLERLSADHRSDALSAEAMTALQAAANQLGLAENVLTQLDGPHADEPAPILDSPAAPADPRVLWSGEAVAVLALAEFTVPYADSDANVVEDWLRALRREGAVGRALGELGFADGELAPRAVPLGARRMRSVERVRGKAIGFARQRRADSVTTTDLLFAVLAVYGKLVDRVLYERGFTRNALLDQVAGGARAMARMIPKTDTAA